MNEVNSITSFLWWVAFTWHEIAYNICFTINLADVWIRKTFAAMGCLNWQNCYWKQIFIAKNYTPGIPAVEAVLGLQKIIVFTISSKFLTRSNISKKTESLDLIICFMCDFSMPSSFCCKWITFLVHILKKR